MSKKLIIVIALSAAVSMAMPYMQQGLQYWLAAYHWIADLLTNIFSGGEVGNTIRAVFALLAMPVVIALIPSAIYWLMKHSWFPWFGEIVWALWLIQTAALVILYKTPAAA